MANLIIITITITIIIIIIIMIFVQFLQQSNQEVLDTVNVSEQNF